MKRVVFCLVWMGFCGWFTGVNASVPGDSVGVKVVNGKAYVLYKIAAGDNLGRISREYGVSVATLEEVNSLEGTGIKVGQVLMVPSRTASGGLSLKNMNEGASAASATDKPAAVTKPVVAAQPANPKSNAGDQNPSDPRKQHIVEKGETMYAVSRKYGVTVEQIKQWNNLTADGLQLGQKLWVSAAVDSPANPQPKTDVAVTKTTDPKGQDQNQPKAETAPTKSNDTNPGGDQTATKVKTGPGVHVVKPGETLFGIARTYGMDVSELRKINRLENATIKEGQALRVKADSPENANQGTALIDALEQVQDSTPKLEQFPDLKVLTAPKTTTVPNTAVVTVYKDKSTGINYKRVEETGRVGAIQDFATDQTRFYAFHRYLPTGSYIRVDYPQKGQSILVEVINQLPTNDPYLIRLSAKCMEYLMVREAVVDVRLRYVIPFGE
jgi:LysM repeat protein